MAVKKLRAVSDTGAGGRATGDAPGGAWRAALGESTRAVLDADRRVFLDNAAAPLDVIARATTGRLRILSTGDSLARLGPLPLGIDHGPALESARVLGEEADGYARLADMIDAILTRSPDFAAVLAEPIAWSTVTVPPADF